MENTKNQTAAAAPVEHLDFELHPDILFSIIKAQAGTLQKAILEPVMNSIDAGATRIDITLTRTNISVVDDGKGFVSRKEIDDFFKVFGTPHKEGDAPFGTYRMGRGQLMAFTRNKWRSGEFSMDVDIRTKGKSFALTSGLPEFKGCRIDAEMYEPLMPSEVIQITDALRQMTKYAQIPVFVNGEQISLDSTKEKWTFEDEDGFYKLRQGARYLDIYNLGVHVKSLYSGESGVGGVFVSRAQLKVNFARNDILVSECQVWKRANAKIRAYAKQFEEKKPVQNDNYRDMMMSKLLSGSFDSLKEMREVLANCKIFTDCSGKHLSFDKLDDAVKSANGRLIAPEENNLRSDKVSQKKLAVVLSPKTLERARGLSMREILGRIKTNARTLGSGASHPWEIEHVCAKADRLLAALAELEDVASSINDRHEIIEDKSLTKMEKLVLRVINDSAWYLARATEQSIRAIRVCRSDTVDGFTDGHSTIFIERKFLKLSGVQGGLFVSFDKIKELLIHEFCHDKNDSTGHGHPAEFYEAFHEASCSDRAAGFSYCAVKLYISAMKRAKLPLRGGDVKALDLLTQVDGDDLSEIASSANDDDASIDGNLIAACIPKSPEVSAA